MEKKMEETVDQTKIRIAASQSLKERNYWLNQLSGEIEKSCFHYDYFIDDEQMSQWTTGLVKSQIPGILFSSIMKLSKGSDTKIFMILVAGVMALLYKYSDLKDIIIGSPIYRQEVEGDYINTIIPLRNKIDENTSLKSLLTNVRNTILSSYENQNFPIDTLFYDLGIPYSEQASSLFDIAVLIKNIHDKKYIQPVRPSLIFSLERFEESGVLELEYNKMRYNEITVERISEHLSNLLEKAIEMIDIPIFQLDILSEKERKLLLYEFNGLKSKKDIDVNQGFYLKGKSLPFHFEQTVDKLPSNVALSAIKGKQAIYNINTINYKELNERANQLARRLREKGASPDHVVGIMVEPSIEMIIGILGILKAGAAYLPFDIDSPQDRMSTMLKDSRASLVITRKHLFEPGIFDGEIVDLEDELLFKGDTTNLENINKVSDLAYIIYTSGSTGNPKGVMVEHQNILNYIFWRIDEFCYVPTDINLQVISFSFDAFASNLYPSLLSGGKVVLMDQDGSRDIDFLQKIIHEEKITIFSMVPSLFKAIIDNVFPANLKTLRIVILGGEKADHRLFDISSQVIPNVEFVNEYGPTESTVAAAFYRGMNSKNTTIIGKPVRKNQLFIMDNNHQSRPLGIPGELCISGSSLSRGYLNHPRLTAQQFVPNPFFPGVLMYKTGDLARWLPGGFIEFLGRKDNQVKIRGYRVELNEIEKNLSDLQLLKEVRVIANKDEKGDTLLYACFVPLSEIKVEVSELRKMLAKKLPFYMIPTHFVSLAKMPLTPTGKLDIKALPLSQGNTADQHHTPKDELEKKLSEIWANELQIEINSIQMDSNFFELGGHSLIATKVVAKIHRILHIDVQLGEIFLRPTLRDLAKYIKQLSHTIFAPIEAIEEKDYYLLSSSQHRLYILQQMDSKNTAYNLPQMLMLKGKPEKTKLEKTFKALIARHESLRTSFHMLNGQPIQRIHNPSSIEFNIESFGIGNPVDLHEAFNEIINKFIKPFDLSCVPLIKAGLINFESDTHLLMVDMHHIISDGISHIKLINDFVEIYEGRQLPELKISYKDYADWQQKQLQTGTIKSQEEYWLKEFEIEISPLILPQDFARPSIQTFEGNSTSFELSSEETRGIFDIARKEDSTLFMVLLAVYNILLTKLSNQEDIVVGVPITGRRHDDLQNIIGMFINTLPLRNYPNGEKIFTQFLSELKEKNLKAFENQDYYFEDIIEKLVIKRDLSRNPLFDTVLVLQNFFDLSKENRAEKIGDTILMPYSFENKTSKFDLTLSATERVSNLYFRFEYCTQLFRETTIQRFIRYFKQIITTIIKDNQQKISNIDILSEQEKRQLLFGFNFSDVSYPSEKVIADFFDDQAMKFPGNPAVVSYSGDEVNPCYSRHETSYRDLNEKSGHIAAILRAKGVRANTIIAIIMERSLEMIACILGVLKAGCAYLPIDPDYPSIRTRYMLADSSAKFVLSDRPAMNEINENIDILDVNKIMMNPQIPLAEGFTSIQPSDLCYIIYTSGTTGKPKGVMIEHRNVVGLMFNDRFLFDFSENDIWTLFHSFSFDFSVWEMYGALLFGGALVLVPKLVTKDTIEFLKILREEKITVLNQTPSAFYNLLNQELKQPPKELYLRYIIFGGEMLIPSRLKEWKTRYPQIKLINMYGITEITVHATFKEIQENEVNATLSNIGMALPTLSMYVMDKNSKLLPIGVVGELCVGGNGVGRGYLNQPDLTFEKFVENAYKAGECLYRSGDQGKLSYEGEIEYLGRIDHQVKIRGFRIEIAEIENQLSLYEDIDDVAVIANDNELGEKYLCAYFVSTKEIFIQELKRYLSSKLPQHMIPSYFVQIDKIPLTSTGKIDRKSLPSPTGSRPKSEILYMAPTSEIERKIVNIWQEVLEKKQVGIHDNFFDLGGNSLNIVKAHSKIKEELAIDVPIIELFRYPTVNSFVSSLNSVNAKEETFMEQLKESVCMMEETMRLLAGDDNEP